MTSTLIFNGFAAFVAILSMMEIHQAARFFKQARDDFVLENRSEKSWEGRIVQCGAVDQAKHVGFTPSRYYALQLECRILSKWSIISGGLKTFR